jgi:hypothetical protein
LPNFVPHDQTNEDAMRYTITINGAGNVESAHFDRWRVTARGLKLMAGDQEIVTIPWTGPDYVAHMPAEQPTGGYTGVATPDDIVVTARSEKRAKR